MLAEVKKALRISHSLLDSEIERLIATAKAELERVGVNSENISEDNPLIQEAIVTYCQYRFTDDEKKVEMFYKSWQTQIDGLRKTQAFREAIANAE